MAKIGSSVLDGLDAPRREAAAVTDALHLVDDRMRRIAGEQKVTMQRMRRPGLVHRPPGRDQGLAQHLPAVDPLPADLGAHAAKKVLLERLEIEDLQQGVEGSLRGLASPVGMDDP